MIRPALSTRILALMGSAIVLLVASGVILAASSHPAPSSSHPRTTRTITTNNSAKKTTSPVVNAGQPTNLITSNTSDADKQVDTAANTQPVTDACSLLTLSVAKQLLGSSASSTAPNSSAPQATGTTSSSCAYAAGSSTVQLIIRKATNSEGASENDVAFGSSRPTHAIAVQGYGQAAYWNPDTGTLNVLGSNNWYVISRSSNTQTDAETTANLLKSGF